jgi:HPt (histidine-containing phosphotransfer) domain-containing protein
MNALPNLDTAALARLQRLGGDTFVTKMIDLFLEFAGAKIVEAKAAHATGDLEGVARAVHPIKSSAGNVGAACLQELATRLEALCREGHAGNVEAILPQLQEAFAAVRTELDAHRPRYNMPSPSKPSEL